MWHNLRACQEAPDTERDNGMLEIIATVIYLSIAISFAVMAWQVRNDQ